MKQHPSLAMLCCKQLHSLMGCATMMMVQAGSPAGKLQQSAQKASVVVHVRADASWQAPAQLALPSTPTAAGCPAPDCTAASTPVQALSPPSRSAGFPRLKQMLSLPAMMVGSFQHDCLRMHYPMHSCLHEVGVFIGSKCHGAGSLA